MTQRQEKKQQQTGTTTTATKTARKGQEPPSHKNSTFGTIIPFHGNHPHQFPERLVFRASVYLEMLDCFLCFEMKVGSVSWVVSRVRQLHFPKKNRKKIKPWTPAGFDSWWVCCLMGTETLASFKHDTYVHITPFPYNVYACIHRVQPMEGRVSSALFVLDGNDR